MPAPSKYAIDYWVRSAGGNKALGVSNAQVWLKYEQSATEAATLTLFAAYDLAVSTDAGSVKVTVPVVADFKQIDCSRQSQLQYPPIYPAYVSGSVEGYYLPLRMRIAQPITSSVASTRMLPDFIACESPAYYDQATIAVSAEFANGEAFIKIFSHEFGLFEAVALADYTIEEPRAYVDGIYTRYLRSATEVELVESPCPLWPKMPCSEPVVFE